MSDDYDKLDEIVFEAKNKDYGAYQLRRSYRKTMLWSLFLGALIFLLTMAIPLIASYASDNNVSVYSDPSIVYIPNQKPDQPPPPPPPPPPPAERALAFSLPVITDGADDPEELLAGIDSITNISVPLEVEEIIFETPQETKEKKIIDESNEVKEIYDISEPPEFPGGDEGLRKYLSENVKYTEMGKETGIEGTVYISFVVEKDGVVSNVNLIRGIGGGLDENAMKVVTGMPVWKPGKQNNHPVRVMFRLPIRFRLEK